MNFFWIKIGINHTIEADKWKINNSEYIEEDWSILNEIRIDESATIKAPTIATNTPFIKYEEETLLTFWIDDLLRGIKEILDVIKLIAISSRIEKV